MKVLEIKEQKVWHREFWILKWAQIYKWYIFNEKQYKSSLIIYLIISLLVWTSKTKYKLVNCKKDIKLIKVA